MRATLGEVAAAPGGAAWVERLLRRNAAIAAAHGHPAREEVCLPGSVRRPGRPAQQSV
jgi:hypothetical protein